MTTHEGVHSWMARGQGWRTAAGSWLQGSWRHDLAQILNMSIVRARNSSDVLKKTSNSSVNVLAFIWFIT